VLCRTPQLPQDAACAVLVAFDTSAVPRGRAGGADAAVPLPAAGDDGFEVLAALLPASQRVASSVQPRARGCSGTLPELRRDSPQRTGYPFFGQEPALTPPQSQFLLAPQGGWDLLLWDAS
jgi:hypothetical protein